MISLSSTQQRITLPVTRTRNRYQVLSSYLIVQVVSFSEASMPLRLERPVTLPPQPPLTSVMYALSTGNVAAAKKSVPSIRMASKLSS